MIKIIKLIFSKKINPVKIYRDNGAVGALLDEYEKTIQELSTLLDSVSAQQLIQIVDRETEDDDCRSIQTIMSHVVFAGYNYSIYIKNKYVETTQFKKKELKNSIEEYQLDLLAMFDYAERLFVENPDLPIEIGDEKRKIHVSWGQAYDIEQIMEHAIVHILRHRRQIERFLLKM